MTPLPDLPDDEGPAVPARPGDDGPHIDMTVARVACPCHGEPFRKEFPKGWLLFSVPLLVKAMNGEKFIAAWPDGAEDWDEEQRVAHINQLFARRPACMFVTRDDLATLYTDANVLVPGICRVCRAPAPGTPYEISELRGPRTIEHLCLKCILDAGDRMHQAHGRARA